MEGIEESLQQIKSHRNIVMNINIGFMLTTIYFMKVVVVAI